MTCILMLGSSLHSFCTADWLHAITFTKKGVPNEGRVSPFGFFSSYLYLLIDSSLVVDYHRFVVLVFSFLCNRIEQSYSIRFSSRFLPAANNRLVDADIHAQAQFGAQNTLIWNRNRKIICVWMKICTRSNRLLLLFGSHFMKFYFVSCYLLWLWVFHSIEVKYTPNNNIFGKICTNLYFIFILISLSLSATGLLALRTIYGFFFSFHSSIFTI